MGSALVLPPNGATRFVRDALNLRCVSPTVAEMKEGPQVTKLKSWATAAGLRASTSLTTAIQMLSDLIKKCHSKIKNKKAYFFLFLTLFSWLLSATIVISHIIVSYWHCFTKYSIKIMFSFDFRVKYVPIWTFLGGFVEIHSCTVVLMKLIWSLQTHSAVKEWNITSRSRSVLDSCICFSICERCSITRVFS